MSLNCLTCQLLPRTDSDREYDGVQEKNRNILRVKVERSWSGNISPPECDPLAKIKSEHRRGHSTGAVGFPGSPGPRLVRSCGMRRDWSFEELAEKKEKRVRFR